MKTTYKVAAIITLLCLLGIVTMQVLECQTLFIF